MMAERGVEVSHTAILRWVIRYVPEFEKRWSRYARRIGSSWRVDETYIPIRGKWHYLYRAVDKQGKTVDFLLRRDRGIAAAQAFFRKALATNPTRWPRKVTLDGHTPSHRALRLLRRENPKWKYVEVRPTRRSIRLGTMRPAAELLIWRAAKCREYRSKRRWQKHAKSVARTHPRAPPAAPESASRTRCGPRTGAR
jgi:transposase-like protein